MIVDELSSFYVLRTPDKLDDNSPHPRVVPAYGRSATDETLAYLNDVKALIHQGDWRTPLRARIKVEAALETWKGGRSPFAIGFAPHVKALRKFAEARSEGRALDYVLSEFVTHGAALGSNLDKWLGEESGVLTEALLQMAARRAALADVLLAAVLCNDATVDREGTAATICAMESIERLLTSRRNPDRLLAWEPAILQGILVFPIEAAPPKPSMFGNLRKRDLELLKGEPKPTTPSEPIRPVHQYVGDLVVVKQHLLSYAMGEVAHIENVLKSENYQRSFRNLKRDEVRLLSEEIQESVTERDLQSTTRDEFKREWSAQKQDNLTLQGGLNAMVSGTTGTGQYVITAGASASYNRSTETREAAAQQHVGEIVSRVQEKITDRVRTVRESITTSEIRDTTTHGFNNVQGDGHIVGVYRWIEKKYQLHLINYGRRQFYEFIIPEPAAFWASLEGMRASRIAGPAPLPPLLPGDGQGAAPREIDLGDFALSRTVRGVPQRLDEPVRWHDIVTLAGQWGVQLELPPRLTEQAHGMASLTPDDKPDEKALAHKFRANINGADTDWWESLNSKSAVPEAGIKIPAGYAAEDGEIAFKTWQKARLKQPELALHETNSFVHENGYVTLLMGGRRFTLMVPVAGANNGAGGFVYGLNQALQEQGQGRVHLEGEVSIGVTTTLEAAIFSIRLDCVRTAAKEREWAEKSYAVFMDAYRARQAEHAAALQRAQLDNARVDMVRPDSFYREVERNELKRAIIDMLMGLQLPSLAGNVLAASGDGSLPAINRQALPAYGVMIDFFERVFDWANLAYRFEAYFYGRGEQWGALATAYNADPQFARFLGAGAARVQLPCLPGMEPLVDLYLNGQFLNDPSRMVPWFSRQQPIAEDLARAARDGFSLSPGRVTIAAGARRATVRGTNFSEPADLQREVRIGGKIYVVKAIANPFTFDLDRPVAAAVDDALFEVGGIVVGAPIDISLPTTLVAIDTPTLTLPAFPGRYA